MNAKPRYLFFGTPHFSATCLCIFLDHGWIPAAVVCNPDRAVGRKKIITPPPVKQVAETWNKDHPTASPIEILQPEKIDAAARDEFKKRHADFFVVYAYNKIFRKETLAIPPHGVIGIHPSLLPKYRGPSPFQTALLEGTTHTGVTLYFLDEGIDSGPIIAHSNLISMNDKTTFADLAETLAQTGAELLLTQLPTITSPDLQTITQDESKATYTKKFTTEDGYITQEDLESAIHGTNPAAVHRLLRKIHALNPEPGVWTVHEGKRIKLLEGEIKDGALLVTITQREGEKPRQHPH